VRQAPCVGVLQALLGLRTGTDLIEPHAQVIRHVTTRAPSRHGPAARAPALGENLSSRDWTRTKRKRISGTHEATSQNSS
jgi:hypothetical protein